MQYVKDCACTESDYECDVGYVRKVEGGPCTPVGGSDSKGAVVTRGQPPENCPSGTTYGVTNGYRKVAGDTCSGGIDRNPSLFPCPHWSTTVSHGGWVVLLILLCIVCGFSGAAFSKRNGKNASANRFNSFSSNFNGSASGIYSTICSRLEAILCCCKKSDNYSGYSVVGKGGAIPESAVGYDHFDDDLGNDDDDDDDDDDDERRKMLFPWRLQIVSSCSPYQTFQCRMSRYLN